MQVLALQNLGAEEEEEQGKPSEVRPDADEVGDDQTGFGAPDERSRKASIEERGGEDLGKARGRRAVNREGCVSREGA